MGDEVAGEVLGDLIGDFVPLSVKQDHEHEQKAFEGGDGSISDHVLFQRKQSLLHAAQLLQMTFLWLFI